jgi:hypothetical protein
MTLKTEPCAFCKKNVVAPCAHSMAADTCSQRAPSRVPPDGAIYAAVSEAITPQQVKQEVADILRRTSTAHALAKPILPEMKPSDRISTDEAYATLRKAREVPPPASMKVQVGGSHYKGMPIQPLTYIEANEMGFSEANVVKYVTRWKLKNGIEDLKKARDILDKKIAFEEAKEQAGLMEYLSALFKSV